MPDVQYLGHSCFRLRGRDGIVLCDPFDSSVGLDLGRPTAHIVTTSNAHPAHSHISAVRPLRDQEEPFLIDGPGEYEIRNVLVTGVRTYLDNEKGAQQGFNTVYVIYLDDVAFCHLGNLTHELTSTQLDEIGNVDVLFVPVGGGNALKPEEAVNVIGQVEPRMVIPMHYATNQLSFEYDLLPLDKFMHETGLKDVEPQEKLTITPAGLPGADDETRIMVMLPGSS